MNYTAVKEKRRSAMRIGKYIKLSVYFLLIACAVIFGGSLSDKFVSSVIICIKKVLPSVFPMLVLSGILIRFGFAELFSDIFGGVFEKITGIDRSFSSSFIFGALFGAPTGAAAVSKINSGKVLPSKDAEKALLLSVQFSPAFVIGVIGVGIFESAGIGIYLYTLQLISSFFGISLFKREGSNKGIGTEAYPKRKNSSFLSVFSASIKDAAEASLSISASVVFFSVLSEAILSITFLPSLPKALIASFFELTSGSFAAYRLLPPKEAFTVIASALGWSGFSIHSQASLITNGELIGRKYFIGKLFSAILSAIAAVILINIGII